MNKIDLKKIEKKINIRQLKIEDYDQLVELQLLAFPGMPTWNRDQLESQLDIFPEGQICIEYEGKIIASSSSLIVDFDLHEDFDSWQRISDSGYITNHNPDGDTLYGIEIMVHPGYRGMRLSRRLYDQRKQIARKFNLRSIVIGGRIPGYHKHKDKMTAREYVDKVISKKLYDQVLTAQLSNGFVLKRIMPTYLKSDAESVGHATLLEWPNLDYTPKQAKKYVTSKKVRICVVQYQMRSLKSFKRICNSMRIFC